MSDSTQGISNSNVQSVKMRLFPEKHFYSTKGVFTKLQDLEEENLDGVTKAKYHKPLACWTHICYGAPWVLESKSALNTNIDEVGTNFPQGSNKQIPSVYHTGNKSL